MDEKKDIDTNDSKPAIELNKYDPGSLKILIIDDDKWILKIISNYFESFGFKVYTALDPFDGIAAAIKYTPNVIVLDYLLPVLTGGQLLKFLKKIEVTFQIPVIIITANLDQHTLKETYELGASSYIIKPFKNEILLEKINEVLGFSVVDFFGLKGQKRRKG